jgi:hypothetical protein
VIAAQTKRVVAVYLLLLLLLLLFLSLQLLGLTRRPGKQHLRAATARRSYVARGASGLEAVVFNCLALPFYWLLTDTPLLLRLLPGPTTNTRTHTRKASKQACCV